MFADWPTNVRRTSQPVAKTPGEQRVATDWEVRRTAGVAQCDQGQSFRTVDFAGLVDTLVVLVYAVSLTVRIGIFREPCIATDRRRLGESGSTQRIVCVTCCCETLCGCESVSSDSLTLTTQGEIKCEKLQSFVRQWRRSRCRQPRLRPVFCSSETQKARAAIRLRPAAMPLRPLDVLRLHDAATAAADSFQG